MAAEDMLDEGLVDGALRDVGAWLELGWRRGWIVAQGCMTHEGLLTVEEMAEEDELDEDGFEIMDRCMPAVRVNFG